MGHMGSLETQTGGRDPPGEPKGMSKAPLGHHSYHFWVLFSMFFNNIHYRISTMPNYLRINKHYALMPTLATPATTQTATNKKGAGGRGEAFKSAAPACGELGRVVEHPFKICQTLSENLSLQKIRPSLPPGRSHFNAKSFKIVSKIVS